MRGGQVSHAVLAAVLACATACSCGGSRPSGGAGLVEPSPSVETSSTSEESEWSTPARIARAVAFRESFDLPADSDWVQAVASMPDAVPNVPAFGMPLTDNEVALLTHRAQTTEAVSTEVQRFVRDRPEGWAGLYVDGGYVVAQFADLTPDLERRLRAGISPDAPLVVRSVRWTTDELDALRDRIRGDEWLPARYRLLDLGVDVRRNEVQLQVAASDDTAIDVIRRHYGDPEMLIVTIDGVGAEPAHEGSLFGHVIDANGASVPGLDVEHTPGRSSVSPTHDVGIATNASGVFYVADIAADDYLVRVYDSMASDGTYLEGSDRRLVGEMRITVNPGTTSEVTIDVPGLP
jgi:hypothetical protein